MIFWILSISLRYHFVDVELLSDILFLQKGDLDRCFGQIIEHGMHFFLNSRLGLNLPMTRFIEIWNYRPLLMFAYWIGEHQQGSSVEVINFLRLICLEVTNSHINWIPVRQQDFGSTKKLNDKLAALEVFLPNRNAFASVVASLKMYCTSRRVILRTSYSGIFHRIFCLLVFIKH